ncbi:hypothetical protein VTJ04DRAFT_8991 [Mycothermus thermophilus]|uniref:uncharacterized protein n=1 Tax=Humicola insolens TaxID=85995 RepID=UPI0037422131
MPKWNELRGDLFEVFLELHGLPDKDQQEKIIEKLKARGHETTWNAIRIHDRQTSEVTKWPLESWWVHQSTLPLLSSNTDKMANGTVWDKKVHDDVLAALVAHTNPKMTDCTAIAEALRGKGYTFSAYAL